MILGFLVSLIFCSLEVSALPMQMSEAVDALPPRTAVDSVAKKKYVYKPNYWYLGAEYFSPMLFDDLYSWTKENKISIGQGVQLNLGYQFSALFGLEAAFGVGRNHALPSLYQYSYWLGNRDAYTYYPYTLIDGTVYHYPFEGNEGVLIGEQGNNPQNITIDGTPFSKIESFVQFWQASLKLNFNLTRLFYTRRYTEKPVELWLRPGVYLSQFKSEVRNKETKAVVAVPVNQPLTWGAGADATFRFNLGRYWAFDVTNRIIWERDHTIDGIRNAKMAYDAFIWEPSLALVYKFRTKRSVSDIPLVPLVDGDLPILPSPLPLAPKTLLDLEYWYPEGLTLPEKRTRTHTAAIYLTYPLNKTYIRRDLHNNPTELARIDREISTIMSNPSYTIRHIKVEGFASPEGPYDNNMRLGEGRARSIIDYIVGQSGLSRGMFSVGRMTENWQGLRDTLTNNPTLPGRDEVLALMNKESDTELVKVRIQKIKGYDYLLEHVYPRLRLSSYTVEYDVNDWSIKQAKDVLRQSPEQLTPEEIYAVAYTEGIDTEEGAWALGLLESTYPNADITKIYQAVVLLNQNDYNAAIAKLVACEQLSPIGLNALGVAYAYTGQLVEATRCFKEASSLLPEARRNLSKVQRSAVSDK